ncbi:hypothetical protein B0180_05410 [Moraxella canis]|uniref:Uncharacterized protein n=1 Tax=Moraxella canis TaxID=90239 RepID=A0A1S9ZKK0_9GAMM|nr:hypothetical protein B0180_05410 [Moraxella canis]
MTIPKAVAKIITTKTANTKRKTQVILELSVVIKGVLLMKIAAYQNKMYQSSFCALSCAKATSLRSAPRSQALRALGLALTS